MASSYCLKVENINPHVIFGLDTLYCTDVQIHCTDVRIHCMDILIECKKISGCFLWVTMKKHGEISTNFRLNHHCGKEVRHFSVQCIQTKTRPLPTLPNLWLTGNILSSLLLKNRATLEHCRT